MPAPEHLKPYLFKPGAPSINPSGRPKGFKGVAAMIMAETGDGAELVRFALDTLRNVPGQRSHAERMEAMHWLADRAIGKPIVAVELAAHLEAGGQHADDEVERRLNTITPEQLEVLAVMHLLPAGGGQLAVLPVLDAEAVEVAD